MLATIQIFERAGFTFLWRWGHIISGVAWIGLLYYFNFVQVPSFAEMEAPARTNAVQKLAPRALWWFRWGAVSTVLFGFLLLFTPDYSPGSFGDYVKSPPGIAISTGILLALIMFGNVWMVIWPNQRVVIENANRVAAGQEGLPNAPASQRKALLASRTNAMLSVPMLFFMAFTSHLAGFYDSAPSGGSRGGYWIIVIVIALVAELNALGIIGGTGPGPTKKFLERHQSTITAGFILAAVFYIFFEIFFG